MTASEAYSIFAEQITDEISEGLPQRSGKGKFIYGEFQELSDFVQSFANTCKDIAVILEGEQIEFDSRRDETFKNCIDDISKYYFYVLEVRKKFMKDYNIPV